jgi:hypothetical protein
MGTARPSPWRPQPLAHGGGWKIEYLPGPPGAAPVLSREMPTCEAAVSRAVDRHWARRNELVAIHGPEGLSIPGDELKALLDAAKRPPKARPIDTDDGQGKLAERVGVEASSTPFSPERRPDF